ncbi:PREDICTED: transcription factor Adf-1-like [Papilio xuthus]|uniref:Transcription factor Adf-1-like n=1 Tax=Papilio xuthus TaxID=66420 RepID=A0AAJ6ZWD4_PAPXU|nr:PREDICTED: transcription factor Adf-1-like [Papilio xuthus]
MDNEKLIQIVRKYKHLYDLNNKYYSNNQKKEQAWNEIGKKLQSSARECKKAWALLRDAYRRCVRKRRDSESGMASVPKKKWKYEDKMSFLLPHMKERPTSCPISEAPHFESVDNVYEEEDIANSLKLEIWEQSDTLLTTPEVNRQPHGTLPASTPSPTQYYPQPRITTKDELNDNIPSTLLVQYLIDSMKNTPPPDEIEQFMAGIVSTVRSFPPRDRVIAKAKIFELISHMELEILSRPSTSN